MQSNGLRVTWISRTGAPTTRRSSASSPGSRPRRRLVFSPAFAPITRSCRTWPCHPCGTAYEYPVARRPAVRVASASERRSSVWKSVRRSRPFRDDQAERVDLVRDRDVRVRVEQRPEQAVARARVADEEAEGAQLSEADRAAAAAVDPARPGAVQARELGLRPLVAELAGLGDPFQREDAHAPPSRAPGGAPRSPTRSATSGSFTTADALGGRGVRPGSSTCAAGGRALPRPSGSGPSAERRSPSASPAPVPRARGRSATGRRPSSSWPCGGRRTPAAAAPRSRGRRARRRAA